MLKRTVALVLTSALVLSAASAYASDAQPLSLESAISMAKEHSPELEMADANKKSLSKQLKAAAEAKKDSKNLPIVASSNFDMIYVKNGYYVNMYSAYLDLASDERQKTEAGIAYGVTEKYYTCKNTLRLCEVALSGVHRAEDNLAVTKQKYELGMCTQLDVTNAEIALEEAKNNLLSSQQNNDLAMQSFKITLGAADSAAFSLTDSLTAPSFEHDLAFDTDKALKTRYDVKALKVSADLAEKYYKASGALGEENPKFHTAYADYLSATHNYSTGKRNIALLIKSAYYDAINAANAASVAQKKLDYKRKEYEVNKLRFEMGMITSGVLTALSDELTMTEISYENALLAYKLAVENYNYQITVGV